MKKIAILLAILFAGLFFSQKQERLPLHKYRVAALSDSLQETSGLTFFNNKLYTINDGGNTSEIFEINPKTGEILQKITTHLPNKDWEAITNDGENLFVGEFGNNAGSRKDLGIYRLQILEDEMISSQVIPFQYSFQTDFSKQYFNHDYDAEAMIFLENHIHLFTKNWKSKSVSHYIINPKSIEIQNLEPVESFPTGFVVTDAAYFENKLYLVGYNKKAKVYLMIFENSNGLFFNKNPKKYRLGSAFSIGQVEGIAVNKDGIYISNESFRKLIFNVKQSLYFIPFSELKE
ncbi:MAG: hypothetical protein KBA33_04235 [Cloacibacterium sp.]|jgi:hypothetical protein|nr:hypothetical protein [Cloacibacterium sp.]